MFSYEDAPNMEREKQEQICQQLRMLAEGRHPLTGKELPLTGAFADAAVLRTLTQASHCLRDLLEQETPAPARRAKPFFAGPHAHRSRKRLRLPAEPNGREEENSASLLTSFPGFCPCRKRQASQPLYQR